MPRKTKKKKYSTALAFTMIEVVLVLAIAGLIFAMVFIGLPVLQRNQRNTQRKDDVDRVFSAIIEYKSNNNNRLPVRNGYYDSNFITRYVDSSCRASAHYDSGLIAYANCGAKFIDPDGTPYSTYIGSNSISHLPSGSDASVAKLNHQILPISVKSPNAQFSTVSENIKNPNEGAIDRGAVNHIMYIYAGAICAESEGYLYHSGNASDFLIAMRLEGGAFYCRSDGTPSLNGSQEFYNNDDERIFTIEPLYGNDGGEVYIE